MLFSLIKKNIFHIQEKKKKKKKKKKKNFPKTEAFFIFEKFAKYKNAFQFDQKEYIPHSGKKKKKKKKEKKRKKKKRKKKKKKKIPEDGSLFYFRKIR